MLYIARLAPQLSVMAFCVLFLVFLPTGDPGEFGAYTLPRAILWIVACINAVDLARSALAEAEAARTPPQAAMIARAASVIAVFIIAAAIIESVGFVITSALLFLACGRLLGVRNWWGLVFASIAVALASWLLFSFVIDLSLPTSPFSRII